MKFDLLITFCTVFCVTMALQLKPAYAEAYEWRTQDEECLIIKNNPYYDLSVDMTDEEVALMQEMVYWEAARCGCPIETCEACVQTVFNRILMGGFGDTVKEVITKKGQFCTKKYYFTETIPAECLELIDDAISEVTRGVEVIPRDYVFFDIRKQKYGRDYLWIGDRRGMWFGKSAR